MKKQILFTFLFLTLFVIVFSFHTIPVYALTGNTIETLNYTTDSIMLYQRKIFYAKGLFWAFYLYYDYGGSNIVYRSSSDGLTWSPPTIIVSRPLGTYGSELFSMYFDGVHLSYAVTKGTTGDSIYYRCGTPNNNGTITWLASEQLTKSGSNYEAVSIGVDSSGYPYITYVDDKGHGYRYCQVTKSSTNNGIWTEASGYPLDLRYSPQGHSSSFPIVVVPLTNNKIYTIHFDWYQEGVNGSIYGRLYNGSSWGTEETIITDSISDFRSISAVADIDNIHLVYLQGKTYNIKYIKRTYSTSSWGNGVTVQSSTTNSSYPVLSVSSSSLYVFWASSPTANHIYYKECALGNGSGTWDTNPTNWLDESTETLTRNDGLTVSYQAYNDKIGLLYSTETGPFKVKFAYLNASTIPTYSLNLRILDWSGSPLSSAIVDLNGQSGYGNTVSNTNGWANFTAKSGTYLVTTYWQGNIINQTSITIRDSNVTTTVSCHLEAYLQYKELQPTVFQQLTKATEKSYLSAGAKDALQQATTKYNEATSLAIQGKWLEAYEALQLTQSLLNKVQVEENNFIMLVAGGGIGTILVIGIVIYVIKKRR